MAAEPRSDVPHAQATWLVLASDGPGRALGPLAPFATRVKVVSEPLQFAAALHSDRPRIAIVAVPPAMPPDIALVLHERRRRSTLRAIHLTPIRDTAARIAALRDGFDEALPETIDPEELAARAMILAERAARRPAARLPIADGFELDLVAHELRVDGRTVHLRPKEYQLLAMLARHPGRAYTRAELLERVWGPGPIGDPRTVDVHVRWLRSKIEPRPERPVHLVTVRGVGYRFDATFIER